MSHSSDHSPEWLVTHCHDVMTWNDMTWVMSFIFRTRCIISLVVHMYEWVMSHIHESRVSCSELQCVAVCCSPEWVMTCDTYMSHSHVGHDSFACATCCTYEWVMYVVYFTLENKSYRTYEWVMSHIHMSHVAHTNESCRTYEWVMSHQRINQVDTHEWVMALIPMSHVTHVRISKVHCNTLQQTATHCNTLQHTATHCNTLWHTTTHCNILQHTATYCNTLQHISAVHTWRTNE